MTQPQLPPGDAAPSEGASPKPTFAALPLSPDVRKALDKMGYVNPSPVQLAVFEPASRGKSLVVQARTGTGKTTAFGLPIVDALVKRSVPGVQALVLTPTRELAIQVGKELEQLAEFRGIKILPIYGGAPMGRQVEALAEGVQIVTGTPGRVLDHLRRGTLDASSVRIFVLDEADEMLSMGFAKELNAIIELLPKDRQGLYFSATIPPDVERLANNHLHAPEWITLSSDQVGALSISHFVYLVREGDKRTAILRIIEVENPESAVVFCNTKDETERVAEALKKGGFDAEWLNGDLEQRERERIMAKTKEGKLRFLVATDVAARGIDISHLTHVINADFPESAEAYVHRTGRTGRAGRTGTAISVVGPKDVGHLYMLRLTYKIRPIERTLPTSGELRTRQEADLVAFLADAYESRTPDPLHLAVARRLLTHGAPEAIIAGLLADHLGASKEDVTQEAAEARRAKNPAPEEVVAKPAPAQPPPQRPRHTDDRRGPQGGPRRDEPGEHRKHEGHREREARRHDDRREREAAARPVAEPARDERRQAQPDRPRDGRPANAPKQDRARQQDRGRQQDHARERAPQSALSNWEPPADDDDDHPLIAVGSRRPPQDPPAQAAQNGQGPQAERPRRDEPRGREQHRGQGGESRRDRHRSSTPGFSIGFTVEDAPASGVPAASTPKRDAEPARALGEDEANIFLNVGRRDGLTPDGVGELLGTSVSDFDARNVRIRDRISFVTVRSVEVDSAIAALIGQVVGGRTVNAERARDR